MKRRCLFSPTQQPYLLADQQPVPAPPSLPADTDFYLNHKVISPLVLLIIVILIIVILFSGLLHILVRRLLRLSDRDQEDSDDVTTLQGRLQQLFNMNDSGLDQSFIDSLPVFRYRVIIGLKNPLDCAVCLCEFEPEDMLRLLPNCSHAFHMECIDTWLYSHSTCPLCRASLIPDSSPNNSCSSITHALESDSESSREIIIERGSTSAPSRTVSVRRTNSQVGFRGDNEIGSAHIDFTHKHDEIIAEDSVNYSGTMIHPVQKVLPVKLGKFRNVDGGESSSTNNTDKRCFSMGSFQYVMDENSYLKVPIRTRAKKKPSLPLIPGKRAAMSECDHDSRREFHGIDGMRSVLINGSASSSDNQDSKSIQRTKKESYSISKTWLRGMKKKQNLTEDSSRRAFSFRFPVQRNAFSAAAGEMKNGSGGARRTVSEIDFRRFRNEGGQIQTSWDEEIQSCNSLDFDTQPRTSSYAKRTLLWLVGRQNKVVNSSLAPNL